MKVVFIFLFRLSRILIISSSVFESRFPVGSSAKITDGSVIKERAILTRCCCPPDSWEGNKSALSGMPTPSNNSKAFCLRIEGATD